MTGVGRCLSLLRTSRVERFAMTFTTQVLHCDPKSILFSPLNDRPTVTSRDTLTALATAANHLTKHLQLVAFPTETVYGLGAVAHSEIAVSRIFSTKGRPADNPLIVHVSSMTMLRTLLPADYKPSRTYQILMDRFWPGPLTLVFPRNPSVVPDIVCANHSTVAVRFPSHPVTRALISMANAPIAAPSANSSGKPSPTQADHVLRDLGGKLGLILDGGPCSVGLESTVVDGLNEDGDTRVLRPGGVSVEDIVRALARETPKDQPIPKVLVHRKDYQDEVIERAPTTPGMKYRHYCPSVPVILLLTKSQPPAGIMPLPLVAFISEIKANASLRKIGILCTSDSPLATFTDTTAGIQWLQYSLGPASEPSIAARRLFDGLLTLEQGGVDLILIEEVEEEMEGLAIMNRVRKAAGEMRWISIP
jgi:L-threonylcarbamoyladenylate synthase